MPSTTTEQFATSMKRTLSSPVALSMLGKLRVYLAFAQGAPRRVAHINRNGMLITDSREQKNSPLSPRGRSLWPDFVGVIVPETDAGDLWLRKMENPSHDSLSSGQLRKEEDRREADKTVQTGPP